MSRHRVAHAARLMSLWAVLAIAATLIAWVPCAFADQPAPTPAASSKESLIDTFIAGTDQTSGVAVAVSADGVVQLRNNYGYEAGPDSAEVGERTAFEWGRTSDLLVWAAVMQLVEAGQLNLNTNLSAYLPEGLDLPEGYESLDLLDLMNHVSGLDVAMVGNASSLADGLTDATVALRSSRWRRDLSLALSWDTPPMTRFLRPLSYNR